MPNSPLSTSFRSVTQATDSTCSGWTAKMAAVNALGHKWPVIARSTRKSSTTFAACSATLTACILAASRAGSGGLVPCRSSCASAISDSNVRGVHFAETRLVKAQATDLVLNPPSTCAFAVT